MMTILAANLFIIRSIHQHKAEDTSPSRSITSKSSFRQNTNLTLQSGTDETNGDKVNHSHSHHKRKDDDDDGRFHDSEKLKVVNILAGAGIEMTESLYESLPTWSEITSLYGSEAKIIGLETCAAYREKVPSHDIYTGPAGLFNTGTFLLDKSLHRFCTFKERRAFTKDDPNPNHGFKYKAGTLFQVPWGKHNPATTRLKHWAAAGPRDIKQAHVLPIIMVKDPYHWMQSMCRHSYQVKWPNQHSDHCPQLVKPSRVQVPFGSGTTIYKSLVHMWNEWNGQYIHYDNGSMEEFPRLVIRYEDLLFHQKDVVRQVCDCVGGTVASSNYIHLEDSAAKPTVLRMHSGSSDLVSAIMRYGKDADRLKGMTSEDVSFAKSLLDDKLMTLFGYNHPNETTRRAL